MYKWYIGHRSGVELQIFSLVQELSFKLLSGMKQVMGLVDGSKHIYPVPESGKDRR